MTSLRAPTSASAVANAFIDIQASDSGAYPKIDQMKLYKLVYYAHAWWLGHKSEPLFDEDVHAWPWGPVVPSLYGWFKDAGRGAVTSERALVVMKTGEGFLDFRMVEPESPSEDVMTFLRQVWDAHKAFTGIQLSNATHAEGEPWDIILRQHGDLEQKPLIPNPVIEAVFKQKIAQQ